MSTQPAPLDLDAIQARADAARPGPWTLHDALNGDGFPGHLWVVENPVDGPGDHHVMINIGTRDDAEFIAAARIDVPALLARVRELEDRLDERTGDIADRALENAQLRADNQQLADRARRALGSLDDLIRDHQDPGAEALGARYQLAQALISHPHTCANCDGINPASCLTT